MMRNEQVVYAWLYGNVAASGNMTTDGVKLYSYNLLVGDRSDGQVRIWDYTASGKFVSQTTSCHIGLALRCAGAPILMMPQG